MQLGWPVLFLSSATASSRAPSPPRPTLPPKRAREPQHALPHLLYLPLAPHHGEQHQVVRRVVRHDRLDAHAVPRQVPHEPLALLLAPVARPVVHERRREAGERAEREGARAGREVRREDEGRGARAEERGDEVEAELGRLEDVVGRVLARDVGRGGVAEVRVGCERRSERGSGRGSSAETRSSEEERGAHKDRSRAAGDGEHQFESRSRRSRTERGRARTENKTSPAGSSNLHPSSSSRSAPRSSLVSLTHLVRASAKCPPLESPMTTTCDPRTPRRRSEKYAAAVSCSAAGKGESGRRRYSTAVAGEERVRESAPGPRAWTRWTKEGVGGKGENGPWIDEKRGSCAPHQQRVVRQVAAWSTRSRTEAAADAPA